MPHPSRLNTEVKSSLELSTSDETVDTTITTGTPTTNTVSAGNSIEVEVSILTNPTTTATTTPTATTNTAAAATTNTVDVEEFTAKDDDIVTDPLLTNLPADPTQVVWVPARLHPTIAPHEFKSWLEEYSSAVNLNESTLGRRRSILSLHSYSKRASVTMDDNSLGIVEEEEAAAASASFHDVADDMSTYDESTNTLKAVLKRRLSLNVPKSLLEGEEGEGVNTSASSPTGDNVSPLSGLNRTSIRRSARSRVYRTGSVGTTSGARSTVLSRRGAHRRFTSSMSEQLANGDRTDGDSPPNSSEPAPTDTGYPITTHGGSSSTPSPIPIMEPQARLNYMQDKEFTVLDRPFPLESHSIRPDEPNPPKRSMDTMSIDERRRPALSDSLRFNVRSTRSSDNLQAAFRKDATMTRPHTISEVRDENASDVATTLEEKRTTTKKSSAWSWLWGGDSQVEAETARMRKRHTATPTIDTSGFTAAASDSGSEGRPSIELGQPNIEMALNGAGKDATEKKKKTGMTSFFFSTSRSKHKNGSNRSANDDTPSSNASSTTATPTTPTPADGSSGNNNNNNNSHLATDSNNDASSPTGQSAAQTAMQIRYTNYNRFPIHIERAIYRLSHVKLSNPRRALVEQVLISNMMFWYLSLISQQSGMSSTSESPNEQRAAREAAAVKSRVAKGAGGRKKKSGGKRKQPAAPLLGQEFTAPIAHNNNYHSSASTSASEDDGDDEDDVPLAQIRHNPPIPAS